MSKNITKEYLDSFKYWQLRDELKKLGVPKAFKEGKKKLVIINEALNQLSLLKKIDNMEDNVEIQLDKLIEEQNNENKKIEENLKAEIIEVVESSSKEIKEITQDINILKRNLEVINMNLSASKGQQRLVLLKKREALMLSISDLAK